MPESDGAPRRLGRYRLVEQLGEGGMAELFRAVIDGPAGFARSVVIKRVLARNEALSEAARAAILTEARLCSRLHHPGIVQVHELGEADGEYFLVMELVDGLDLGKLLRAAAARGTLVPVGIACHLIAEVAQALAYAHAAVDAEGRPLGLIHRDVSPSNIMIGRSGSVKLLDFGIAKAAFADDKTRTGTLKGKIPYMSPEQADGRPLNQQSDIFSLGVVFYECLVGRRLFPRDNELETLRMVRQANIAPPSTVRPDVDGDVDRVVMRMLARALADRYARCEDVVAELVPIVRRLEGDATALRQLVEALLASGPVVAVEPAPAVLERTAGTEAAALLPTRPHTLPLVVPRRRRLWTGLVAASALAAATVSGWRIVAARRHAPVAATSAPRTTSATTPTTAPPATTTAPPSPRVVRLRVLSPPHARVRVDGRDVGTVPVDLARPAQATPRVVIVSAPGFLPWTERVAGDDNYELSVRLQRAGRHRAQPTPDGRAHPPSFDPESPLPP